MLADISNIPKWVSSGRYLIRVTGEVRKELTDFFDGVENIESVKTEKGIFQTTLIIQARDQAALVGLINTLYDWHHVLITVGLDETEARS